MKMHRLFCVTLALALCGAGPLRAQDRSKLYLVPRVGAVAPLSPLYDNAIYPQFQVDRGAGPLAGLAVHAWPWGNFGLRLDLEREWTRTKGPSVTRSPGDKVFTFAAAALYSSGDAARGFRPYFALGGGLRTYEVESLIGGEPWVSGRCRSMATYGGVGVRRLSSGLEVGGEVGGWIASFRRCQSCVEPRAGQFDLTATFHVGFPLLPLSGSRQELGRMRARPPDAGSAAGRS